MTTPTPPSYAQSKEDLLIWDFFARKPEGFFVEVGANDPENLSQTRLLEEQGWRGILVEPLPDCCDRLRRVRSRAKVFQLACGSPAQRGRARFRVAAAGDRSSLADCENYDPTVQFTRLIDVEIRTLDDLLAQEGHPRVDFVSIDVEGAELSVLQGFDLDRHQPALLLVEDYVYTLAVHRHLTGHGYKLVRRTGSNNWYVPRATPFPQPFRARVGLFRKMYAATPLRILKRWLKQRHRPA